MASIGGKEDAQKVRRRPKDERVVDACAQIRKWLSTPQIVKTANPRTGTDPPKDCATPPHSTGASRISAQTPSIPSHTDAGQDEQHKNSIKSKESAQIPEDAQADPDDDHFRTIVSEGSMGNDDAESDRTGKAGAKGGQETQFCHVSTWKIETDEAPVVSITNANAKLYSRDIDTCTGEFLPEIEHPTTLREILDGPSESFQDLTWRQLHMSSELHIQREMSAREKIAAAVRLQVQDEQGQAESAAEHNSNSNNNNNNNNKDGNNENDNHGENKRTAERGAQEEAPWPRANCTVRPAEPKDFAQIATIMTLESAARECPQIVEHKAVIRAADVEAIFHSCRKAMQPFIVATSPDEQLLDRSRWPAGADADAAHGEYLAWRRAQPAKAAETVFGFALLRDARAGVLSQASPRGGAAGSRFSCQVRLAVHPEHRGRAYGSALLDRVLLCAAPYHRSALDYAWRCAAGPGPARERVYEAPAGRNGRRYNWVYVENLSAAAGRRDERAVAARAWRGAWLEGFGFREVARFEDAVRTERGLESEWLDLELWALEAQPAANIHDGPVGSG